MILQTGMSLNKEISKPSGFTMVELILIVLILSVIAAIAVPNFSGSYAKIQLKNNVYDMASLMRYAQSRAVIQNTKMKFQFDTNDRKYWIEQEQEDGVYKPFSGRMGGQNTILPGITIERERDNIIFSPDGRITKVYVTLCRDQRCYTISTKEQRGFVHVLTGRI